MKITTNFNEDTFFVLTDTLVIPIAVLHFPKGENDVTEKIRTAIEDELQVDISISFQNEVNLSLYSYSETISFSKLFEGEEEIEDWTLTKVTMY